MLESARQTGTFIFCHSRFRNTALGLRPYNAVIQFA